MNELFDFGSRPIRAIEEKNKFRFVHDKEGWTIAETTQGYVPYSEDEAFVVWDVDGDFMGTVVDYGNLATLVSQIYDHQCKTPTEPDYVWVVFAEVTDGGVEIATISREVHAPILSGKRIRNFQQLKVVEYERIKKQFLDDINAKHILEAVEIVTIYGPYLKP